MSIAELVRPSIRPTLASLETPDRERYIGCRIEREEDNPSQGCATYARAFANESANRYLHPQSSDSFLLKAFEGFTVRLGSNSIRTVHREIDDSTIATIQCAVLPDLVLASSGATYVRIPTTPHYSDAFVNQSGLNARIGILVATHEFGQDFFGKLYAILEKEKISILWEEHNK